MQIKNLVRSVKNIFVRWFIKKPIIMNDLETISYIVKNNCSIARYGDGELSLMEGMGIKFQNADENLKKKLIELTESKEEKFLVCIPDIFDKRHFNRKLITKNEYNYWVIDKIKREFLWRKYFANKNILGDAFVSRFYIRKKDKINVGEYVDKLKQIWDKRNIVFVEGKNSRLGYKNDLFDNSKSIKRILCPTENAFEKYDKIIDVVKKKANKEDLIILALGPTATVMAYDLHKLGFQSLDLGHIDIEYEWYKMKATKKEPVISKHVNECNSLGETTESKLDNNYLDQIVAKLY